MNLTLQEIETLQSALQHVVISSKGILEETPNNHPHKARRERYHNAIIDTALTLSDRLSGERNKMEKSYS